MVDAVSTGRLEIVQWVDERYIDGNYRVAIARAIACGHLGVLEWLFENTPAEWNPGCLGVAVNQNQVKSAKWLHAKFGHLEDFGPVLPNERTGFRNTE